MFYKILYTVYYSKFKDYYLVLTFKNKVPIHISLRQFINTSESKQK